ncbi:MAG: DUF2784 domain-containing protein [Ramlibacter sp.]
MTFFGLLADITLALHVAIVAFVVGGLLLIFAGNAVGWTWVNSWLFRLAHIAAIAIVAAQAWLGMVCPLTTLEMWLRSRAGETGYAGTFIGHWLQVLLYYDAPAWVFTAVYTLFALLVVAAWVRYPPAKSGRSR